MLKNPHTDRRVARRAHARIGQGNIEMQSSLMERMRACVSQDRFEAVSRGGDCLPEEPGAQQLHERRLLLQAVDNDSELIRSSLTLCERITKMVSHPRTGDD